MQKRLFSGLTVIAVLLAAFVFSTSPAHANSAPGGSLDAADCTWFAGWAYDPDTPNDQISVHVYYDNFVFLGATQTNLSRPDVNSALGISGNHGFGFTTPDSLKDGKVHTIYAFGIDSAGDSSKNTQLSGSPKTIQCAPATPTPTPTPTLSPTPTSTPTQTPSPTPTLSPTPTPTSKPPIGWIDVANCDVISGWAFDQDEPSTSIKVRMVDVGDSGKAADIGDFLTNSNRADVDSAYGISGVHGFSIATPANLKDGTVHQILASGIDSQDGSAPTQLSGSPKSIQCSPTSDVKVSLSPLSPPSGSIDDGQGSVPFAIVRIQTGGKSISINQVSLKGNATYSYRWLGDKTSLKNFEVCELSLGGRDCYWNLYQLTADSNDTHAASGQAGQFKGGGPIIPANSSQDLYIYADVGQYAGGRFSVGLSSIGFAYQDSTGAYTIPATQAVDLMGSQQTVNPSSSIVKLKITSPLSGKLKLGDVAKISWTDDQKSGNDHYTLFLTTQNGSAFGIISNDVFNTQSFDWRVGDLADQTKAAPGDNYYIQVSKEYTNNGGGSDQTGPLSLVANSTNNPPIGWLDIASCDFISGWTFNQNSPNDAVQYEIWDGPDANGGSLVFAGQTNSYRDDVDRLYGISGYHGYSMATPDSLKDGQPHSIYAYAIDNQTAGGSVVLLSGAPKSIQCQPTISITTDSLRDDTIGIYYTQDIDASGGTDPYQWKIIRGKLPAGLSLDAQACPTSGVCKVPAWITGFPTTVGSSTFTVKVSSGKLSATKKFTIDITPVSVQGADSDNSPDYDTANIDINSMTPQTNPDLFIAGKGTGIYAGGGGNYIYGQEPDPTYPKPTSDPYSTFYDYCYSSDQLNEAYVNSRGLLGAFGFYLGNTSYQCQNGVLVARVSGAGSSTNSAGNSISVSIRAKGTPAQGQYPRMELHAGSNLLNAWYVTGDWADYTVNVPTALSDNLRVYFTNDFFGSGQDRNLYVDSVTVNNKVYSASDPGVFAKGKYVSGQGCTSGFLKTGELDCNNSYLEFPTLKAVTALSLGNLAHVWMANMFSALW